MGAERIAEGLQNNRDRSFSCLGSNVSKGNRWIKQTNAGFVSTLKFGRNKFRALID